MVGLNTSFRSDHIASNTQLYQYITFSGDTLNFKSFTVTYDLFDDSRFDKNKDRVNRIEESELVKIVGQRTQIQEKEIKNYTPQKIQIYQPRISTIVIPGNKFNLYNMSFGISKLIYNN